jgi:predicted nucleic acid-binding protein
MALAKIGALDVLFRLFPKILTPPAVHHELITEGLRLAAPDAAFLQDRYESGELAVVSPRDAPPPAPALGPGEAQSILLAIEKEATWLLIDDLDARRAALNSFATAGSKAQIKGTLGVILAAGGGALTKEEAIQLVEALRNRPDIWISSNLCDHALDLLDRYSRSSRAGRT